MNKSINNKRYNTETSQLCGTAQNGQPGDADYSKEDLYRKRSGEFFLYIEGTFIKADIKPLTRVAAIDWVEKHLGKEAMEDLFTVEDSDDKETKGFRLSRAMIEQIRIRAEQTKVSQSDVVEAALRQFFE